jgi:hypothetical protein
MKRFFNLFVLLLITSIPLFPQQTQPDEKKIYRSDDDRLYINKGLGIYLWISTSPDPESEKTRLTSDSSKQYSNPMYFDTEGYNSIRHKSAVDTLSQQQVFPLTDVIFEVYADGLPPVSKATFL